MGITLAHLKEAVDRLLDRIALVAQTASKSIEEMGKTKADKVNIMSLTIPASGWSSDSTAGCPYYLDIPVSGLTANDCVAVVVAPTCAKTALTAGLTYKIYDNKSDVITPVGEKLTAEQWLDRYQWGRYTKMIVGGGIINGSVALVLDDEVERYRKAGCDFSACTTDEDYLAAIEAFEDNPPMADAGVSDQTRIADALEDMVALSLPDDTTNTTEE